MNTQPPPVVARPAASACSDDQVRDAFGARVSLVGRIMARDSTLTIPTAFADEMYAALANRRVRVEMLDGPASARVEFTVDRQGTVMDGILPRYTGPVWFAEEVLGTLANALLTRSIPSLPREVDADTLDLVLEVRAGSMESGWRPFPLRVALDTGKVNEQVMMMPGMRAPRYPVDLRYRGINGDVLVQYIVDVNGRADLTSISVEQSTALGFLHAALEQLPTFRFYPAILNGCAVPAWVTQPFSFRIGSDAPL